LPEHWKTALFERFKATYRNKFTSKFANTEEYNETMQEWGYALVDLSPEQLKRGIELSIKTMAWPPDIAEFIALAKGGGIDWRQQGAAYKPYVKALPKPAADRSIGRAALHGLRAVL